MTPHRVGEPSQACPLATRPCLNRAGPSSCFIHSLNKAQASAVQIRQCLALSVFFPSIYASCNLCKLQFASFCMWLVFTAAKDSHLGKCIIHVHVARCMCIFVYMYVVIRVEWYSQLFSDIITLLALLNGLQCLVAASPKSNAK